MTQALLVNGQTINYDRYQIVQDGTNPAQVLFYSTAAGLVGANRAQDITLLNTADPQSAPSIAQSGSKE